MLPDLRLTLPSATGIVTYPAGALFGPRHIRDYEFVWIIEGDCEYRRGSVTVPAPPGSVVLCRPGETDFFRWDRDRRTQHAYFHFNLTRWPKTWPKQTAWPLVRNAVEGEILAT